MIETWDIAIENTKTLVHILMSMKRKRQKTHCILLVLVFSDSKSNIVIYNNRWQEVKFTTHVLIYGHYIF